MDFGSIFDFGGEEAGDQPMTTPQEAGGWFAWLPDMPGAAAGAGGYASGGGLAAAASEALETAKEKAGPVVARSFVNAKLAALFEGDDAFGVDLITYAPSTDGGWWPDLSLTPAGKKWGLILLAAGVGFWMVKR